MRPHLLVRGHDAADHLHSCPQCVTNFVYTQFILKTPILGLRTSRVGFRDPGIVVSKRRNQPFTFHLVDCQDLEMYAKSSKHINVLSHDSCQSVSHVFFNPCRVEMLGPCHVPLFRRC